jgi:hypothetical protein
MTSPLDYAFRVSPESITVTCLNASPHAGASFTWQKTHPNFEKVLVLIRERKSSQEIFPLMNTVNAVKKVFEDHPHIDVTREGVFWRGELVHNAVTERIMQFMELDLDVKPLVSFMGRLFKNRSRSAVTSLYEFLERNDVPITESGTFIAYKRVRSDYMDCYSGTFDNSVGQAPECDPWSVDENRDNGCSNGLHVCGRSYLPHYTGERVMVVEVDPEHVVAVPRDYDFAKMRVYKYLVIDELEQDRLSLDDVERSPLFPSTSSVTIRADEGLHTVNGHDPDDNDDDEGDEGDEYDDNDGYYSGS